MGISLLLISLFDSSKGFSLAEVLYKDYRGSLLSIVYDKSEEQWLVSILWVINVSIRMDVFGD